MITFPCVCVKLLQLCLTLCDPMDCSLPGSMAISRHKYWSELSCPPPGNLPDPGIGPMSPAVPAFKVDSLPSQPPGKPLWYLLGFIKWFRVYKTFSYPLSLLTSLTIMGNRQWRDLICEKPRWHSLSVAKDSKLATSLGSDTRNVLGVGEKGPQCFLWWIWAVFPRPLPTNEKICGPCFGVYCQHEVSSRPPLQRLLQLQGFSFQILCLAARAASYIQ